MAVGREQIRGLVIASATGTSVALNFLVRKEDREAAVPIVTKRKYTNSSGKQFFPLATILERIYMTEHPRETSVCWEGGYQVYGALEIPAVLWEEGQVRTACWSRAQEEGAGR